MQGSRGDRSGGEPAFATPSAASDPEASRAADALRRAGGALPIERLSAVVAPGAGASADAVARCLRRRADLFLMVDRPATPWGEEWTPSERVEYAPSGERPGTGVILLDGSGTVAEPPSLVRETLLSMWAESPEDEELRRELGRTLDSAARRG